MLVWALIQALVLVEDLIADASSAARGVCLAVLAVWHLAGGAFHGCLISVLATGTGQMAVIVVVSVNFFKTVIAASGACFRVETPFGALCRTGGANELLVYPVISHVSQTIF